MLVIKAHKILLTVSPETEKLFVSWCGASRWAYNYGLSRKKEEYHASKKSPRNYTLAKEIVKLKKTIEYAWLKNIPKSIPRTALVHLEMAYNDFFNRLKKNAKHLGFPKFKSKKHSRMCFHLEPDSIAIKNNEVRIPKIGWTKMHQSIRFAGKLVSTVCVSCTAGRWYISFSVETEVDDPIEKQERKAIGVDVGIRHLAVLSNGEKFDNPKVYYQLEKLLARAQRQLSRKQKGSKRWQKAKLRVQRVHKRIVDTRSNTTHHVSTYIATNYNGVAIEDLNVSGMVQNRYLAKALLDANISELHRQLRYKVDWSGGEIRQAGRFFPSSKLCSVCSSTNKNLTLYDREWTCKCGICHDRDINAAINLVNKCFEPMAGGSWTWTVKHSKTV